MPGCTSAQKNNNKWSINTVIAYFVSRLNIPNKQKSLILTLKALNFLLRFNVLLSVLNFLN